MSKILFLLFLCWTSLVVAQVDSTQTIRPTKTQKELPKKKQRIEESNVTKSNQNPLGETLAVSKIDSLAKVDSVRQKHNLHAFVGVDLFQPLLTAFTDKTSFGAYIQVPVYKNWNAVLEGGVESLVYDELGWDIDASGFYGRLGGNWFFSTTEREPFTGFYTGFRIGYANFNQTINNFPIRGLNANGETSLSSGGSLGQESGSAFWLEPLAGGRVKLFNTNFYADISVRLQVLVSETNGHNITALAVPGYGIDNGNFSGTIYWGLGYRF